MSVVYALRVPGFLKIGIATDVAKRVRELQTGQPYPLQCVGYCGGGREKEAALHKALAEHRACGEWFADNDAVHETCAREGLLISSQPVPAPNPLSEWGRLPSTARIAVDSDAAEDWLAYLVSRALPAQKRPPQESDALWSARGIRRMRRALWWSVGDDIVRVRCSRYSWEGEPTIWRVFFESARFRKGGEWTCLPDELAEMGGALAAYLTESQHAGEQLHRYEWTAAAEARHADALRKRNRRRPANRQQVPT